jgi:hypothetical protein
MFCKRADAMSPYASAVSSPEAHVAKPRGDMHKLFFVSSPDNSDRFTSGAEGASAAVEPRVLAAAVPSARLSPLPGRDIGNSQCF